MCRMLPPQRRRLHSPSRKLVPRLRPRNEMLKAINSDLPEPLEIPQTHAHTSPGDDLNELVVLMADSNSEMYFSAGRR